jgi:hypothetical protein
MNHFNGIVCSGSCRGRPSTLQFTIDMTAMDKAFGGLLPLKAL